MHKSIPLGKCWRDLRRCSWRPRKIVCVCDNMGQWVADIWVVALRNFSSQLATSRIEDHSSSESSRSWRSLFARRATKVLISASYCNARPMCGVQALEYIYHLRIIWWVEDQRNEMSRISISAGGQGLMGEKQREMWKMRVRGLLEVTTTSEHALDAMCGDMKWDIWESRRGRRRT